MVSQGMSEAVLELLARRFKVLADPARLRILDALRNGEQSVSDLIKATGMRQANVSRHLQVLYDAGFVDRRKAGLNVYYRLDDETVFQICDLMCGRLKDETEARTAILAQFRSWSGSGGR